MSPAQEDPYTTLTQAAWLRVRPSVERRIATLEAAADNAAAGTLDQAQRSAAETEAHRLAGSLGSYGFDKAGQLAKHIESLLETGSTDTIALANAAKALATLIRESSLRSRP
jgi:HPt (histidine-containing phosphotransfer) domain-containing protein